MFINPKVLSDLTPTIHQLSSAIINRPCSAPPWVGRKTCRIRFCRKKKCIALLKFQTILQKNAPFSAGNFPGVCDCIYNGHCKISNSSIKPESGILLSQQRGQKQPQATSLHIEILAARCSRVLSKYDLINGLLGWLCYKSCC